MAKTDLYGKIKAWKKPLHIAKTSLAKGYLKSLPNTQIIGITGSVGKTLTQNAIAAVLSQRYKVVKGDENLDPTFRIPQTILSTKPWHQKIVLEYGIEKPHEMSEYLKIAKPNIAVVTAIAPTHLKYFKNVHGVFDEKSKLVSSLPKEGVAVLNADDSNVVKMANLTHAKVMFFGKNAKDGLKISHYKQNLNGSSFRIHYGGERATVKTKIIGKHQLLSIYAAATVGISQGLTLKQIAKGLSQVKQPDHRLSAIVTKETAILDDTYNSSPKAASESVKTLVDLGKFKTKIAVLGEMKDLGEQSIALHSELGAKIAKTNINYLITIGPVAKEIGISAKKNKFSGKITNFDNVEKAIKEAKKVKNAKALILVKGSRHAHLERVVSGLLGKSTRVNCYHCGVLE